jgi:hypothetical protein
MQSIQRLEELQTWADDTAEETPIEERGWCLDIADAIGELIARRRVEEQQASAQWRVVVRYDDPRGGIYRGPTLTRKEAERHLVSEQSRVCGTAWIEKVGV